MSTDDPARSRASEARERGGGAAESRVELQLRSVSKHFGPTKALDDVSLTLHGGEIHALCGHNGAGKSTLMNVIMGLVQPDSGELVLDGVPVSFRNSDAAHRAGLSIVDQELGLVPALSVEENIFLGNVDEPFITRPRRRRARARQLLAEVGLADLHLRTPLESLQPGQRKLVEVAHVLGHEPRLMILDEPTASLSYSEARLVFAAAKRAVAAGAGVVFVSHRLDEVFEICRRVTVLRDGRRVDTKPIDQVDRATLVDMMVGDIADARPAEADAPHRGPAIRLEGVSIPPRVERVDLELPAGAIVGLAGTAGSGASDLLRGLAGLEMVDSGSLVVGGREIRLSGPARMGRHGIHYVTNDRKSEGLFFDHNIETNVTATRLGSLTRFGVLSTRARKRAAADLVERTGLRFSGLRQNVGELSGGNQQKILIGRCLDREGGELLLLDDPTRGVDVGGRSDIHGLIRQAADAGHAVLFVSTELEELFDLADVIATVRGGRVISIAERRTTSPKQVLGEMTFATAGEAGR